MQHTGMREGEIFVGNHPTNEWPVHCLRGLKTARLGEQALDIHGNKIDRDYMRPLFVARNEAAEYSRIMMGRFSAIMRGYNTQEELAC